VGTRSLSVRACFFSHSKRIKSMSENIKQCKLFGEFQNYYGTNNRNVSAKKTGSASRSERLWRRSRYLGSKYSYISADPAAATVVTLVPLLIHSVASHPPQAEAYGAPTLALRRCLLWKVEPHYLICGRFCVNVYSRRGGSGFRVFNATNCRD